MASPLERRLGLRAPAPPSGRRLATSFLVLLLPAVIGLVLVEQWAPRFAFGIARKPSGMILGRTVEFLTDFDRDGTGLLAKPADPAPLDPGIHPYALDIPGNGIDENGFAGDHPKDFRLPERPDPELGGEPPDRRPSLLLVFLESFRGDLLETRHRGREVTPYLNALASEGAATRHAYVHTPYSGPSREQLFSGRTEFETGDGTLYKDFGDLGYEIAHFSGQDDTHADAVRRLALDEADVFYDARDDVDRRTSRSTASVSLQVSWKTLLGEVLSYLESREDRRPLLLYVNVVDTHFPYDHGELDDLLGVGRLPRSAIHADNVEGVRAAYMNAAANVDRATARLVEAWETKMGPNAPILVTADHGQSFYERGMLGHGQSLGSAQTRVPFILRGVGGTWPEPLGLTDVRALLLESLFGDPPTKEGDARFVARPGRKIFQILGSLERPHLLGLRERDRARIYDMATSRVVDDEGRRAIDGSVPLDRREILLTWEAHRLQEAGMQRGPAEPKVHGASP